MVGKRNNGLNIGINIRFVVINITIKKKEKNMMNKSFDGEIGFNFTNT
jgi:hypothetical protein